MSRYLITSAIFWTGLVVLYAVAVRRNVFGLYGRRLRTANVTAAVASALLIAFVAWHLSIDWPIAAKSAVLAVAVFVPLARWSRRDLATKVVGSRYVDRSRAVSSRFLLVVVAAAMVQALTSTAAGRHAIALVWPVLGLPIAWFLLSLSNLWRIAVIERRLGRPLVIVSDLDPTGGRT